MTEKDRLIAEMDNYSDLLKKGYDEGKLPHVDCLRVCLSLDAIALAVRHFYELTPENKEMQNKRAEEARTFQEEQREAMKAQTAFLKQAVEDMKRGNEWREGGA